MKNVVMTMLLMLLTLAVFIHASEASLKCYNCGPLECDHPRSDQTCDNGNVCLKTSNAAGAFLPFYRAMLRLTGLWDCMSSVCLSVCDVKVCFSHTLEYFRNNFTAE